MSLGRLGLAILLPAVVARAEAANPPPCRTSPHLVGPCWTAHGRLGWGNGNPAQRIWPVGTRRMLGVVDGNGRQHESDEFLPRKIRVAAGDHPISSQIFGDFDLCPLSRSRPGWMQFVCIADVRRMVVVRRD